MKKIEQELFHHILIEIPNINSKLKKIEKLIDSQKISDEDKLFLKEKIYGNDIIDESNEIESERMQKSYIYKTLYSTIKKIIDGSEKNNLSLEKKKKIIYFLSENLEIIFIDLHQMLGNKQNILDKFKKDYLSDKELKELDEELEIYFQKITKVINLSNELDNILK